MPEPLVIYVSGMITDGGRLPFADARERFLQGCQEVADMGYKPVSPIDLCEPMGLDCAWRDYMKVNIRTLIECDGAYFLRDWHQSKGARGEHFIATLLDLLVLYQSEETQ